MFLSTSSIRPLFQDENAENGSIKKTGLSKSTNVQLRTPFKDRSVNISPFSKGNRQVIHKKDGEGVFKRAVKNDCMSLDENLVMNEDDIFSNDYASFKEIPDGFEDVYPSKRLDIFSFLNEYVSGRSPKYIPDNKADDNFDEISIAQELEIPKMEIQCMEFSSAFCMIDVPLPALDF